MIKILKLLTEFDRFMWEAKKMLSESEFCQFVEQISDNLSVFESEGE